MRRRRAHALTLMMLAIVAVGVLLATVGGRIDRGVARRDAADRRIQALWLARSAVRTRVAQSRVVPLERGASARVRVFAFGGDRFAADVVVPGHGVARVEATFGRDGRIRSLDEDWRSSE